MDDNRSAIIKELIALLLVAALLFTAAGFALRNVIVAVRALDGAPAAADDFSLDAARQALRDLGAKLLPASGPTPPSAAPQPAAPAGQAAPAAQKGEVTAVRFFAADKLPPLAERRYADQFTRPSGNIYIQISFKNNSHKIADASIPLIIRHIDPAGRMAAEIKKTAEPKKEWASASFATALTAYKPGAWPAGRHTVKILFDGEPAGEYSFTIQ
jgi:hypothetical protein